MSSGACFSNCRLYNVDAVRELDRVSITEKNIPGLTLMERAGAFAFSKLRQRWPNAKKILVCCGGGNNAGDGYILARLAKEAGLHVHVVQLVELAALRGDARAAAELSMCREITTGPADETDLKSTDIIVDAIFGVGLNRPVENKCLQLIERINASGKPVLALDIPTGLEADTGRRLGSAIKADMTCTFIGLKQGMFTAEGPGLCGEILYSSLDIPEDVFDSVEATASLQGIDLIRGYLPARSANSHKGDFGHLLVIGGDYGFAGAARLCSEAALRTGAGLVTLATRPEHALTAAKDRPELMTQAVESANDINTLLEKVSVVAIGPGLGQSSWASSLLAKVLQSPLPLVVDADALNLLAVEPVRRDNWVLTPHPGEAGRLLDSDSAEIQSDRFKSVLNLVEKYRAVTVLKGKGTLVAAERQQVSVCVGGNPGMASGGMGDILTGIIAALVAQSLSCVDAARVGVELHARAGDKAAEAGERGMLASDLLPHIRLLVN